MADQKVRRRLADQSVRSKRGFATNVDIVFGIDATGSMNNLITEVKKRALTMHQSIISGLKEKDRRVEKLRVKVVAFRDIYADPVPFEESEFFTLPEQEMEFRAFVDNIRAGGGGDEPENALEAMCMAMQSRFLPIEQGKRARQIIVMLTDASAHRLDHPQRASSIRYPQEIPDELIGVQEMWESTMDARAKRMVVFAPNVWPWNEVALWNCVDYIPSAAGVGIDGDAFDSVISAVSGSI